MLDVSSVNRFIEATIIKMIRNKGMPSKFLRKSAIHRDSPLFPKALAMAIPPPKSINIPQGNFTVSFHTRTVLSFSLFLVGIINRIIAKILQL